MKALITGITGQDGAYLSRLLLEEGFEVHGMVRRNAQPNMWRLNAVGAGGDIHFHSGDMVDGESVRRVIDEVAPDRIYNLAAQSHVGVSFKQPGYTQLVNAVGVGTILSHCVGTACRIYQASTSELYGKAVPPQSEVTPFDPVSPYAHAKFWSHVECGRYRAEHNLFVSCGILFNHESALRGDQFVTQKIAKGINGTLRLGNMSAKRDWGHAADYVRAMYQIIESDHPRDYVVATGETRTVKEFLEAAEKAAGVKAKVEIDPKLFREVEVPALCGDATKIKRELGWEPQISFEELVRSMVRGEVYPNGFQIAA